MATSNTALAERLDELSEKQKEIEGRLNKSNSGTDTTKEVAKPEKVLRLNDSTIEELEKAYGKKAVADMLERATTPTVPKGYMEINAATWDAGWKGKVTVITSTGIAAVGCLVTLGALLEGIGKLTGWSEIQVISKFCNWYTD